MMGKRCFRYVPDRGFFRVWRWLDGLMFISGGTVISSPTTERICLVGPYETLEDAYGAVL
jgi:hypothetical protein